MCNTAHQMSLPIPIFAALSLDLQEKNGGYLYFMDVY